MAAKISRRSVSSLSDPPPDDTVEVSIFGPGKGESIVLHLGDQRWAIIDSCREQGTGKVAALNYLTRIGINPASNGDLVVATHAHDDHIAGLAEVVEVSESAKFVSSSAIVSEEFWSMAQADSVGEQLMRQAIYREYRAIFDTLTSRKSKTSGALHLRALPMRTLLTVPGVGGYGRGSITALSPSDEAVTRSLTALASSLPKKGEQRRVQVADPNEFAVAVWVSAGGHRLLLGADLLKGPAGCGWTAVLSSWSPEERAEVFKVPHHGAPNAHHSHVWSDLLESEPVALVAPYRAGVRPRPDPEDCARIAALSGSSFITASPSNVAPSAAVKKTAAAMGPLVRNVRQPDGLMGHVRARAAAGSADWVVDYVHPARIL